MIPCRQTGADSMTQDTHTGFGGVTMPDGARADIAVADGRIAAILPAGMLPDATDMTGYVALPPLVEAHIHLDKTLLGLPFQSHLPGATVADRIAQEKSLRASLPLSAFERGGALVRQGAGYGTQAMRSHVDIDGDLGLSGLEDLLKLRESVADLAEIQIVAFPQNGILRDAPVAGLLAEALANGADLVGGLDPAGIDRDVAGHLDVVFGLADRFGVGVDIHLHDAGELGLFELADIAKRTEALGLQGKVAVSHAFALGSGLPGVGAVVEALAKARVSIVTNGPNRMVAMPPVAMLRKAGVAVVAGSDNIRDAWSPHGDGDMLRRAGLIAYMQDFRDDSDLEVALSMATSAGARLLGLSDYGLSEGARADMLLVRASCVAEAVAGASPDRVSVRGGRVIARDCKLV